MNQDNDQDKVEVDAQVSDQYKSLANEGTPPHLDQAVLREAKRALRADNRKGFFGAWFRPVAFVTTVGLSLAIILELSDTGIFSPVTDLPVETAPGVPAIAGPSDDRADKAQSQPTLSEIKRQEKLAPAESPTTDAPETAKNNAASVTPQGAARESVQTGAGQQRKMRMEAVPAIAPSPDVNEDQDHAAEAFTVEAGIAEQRVQKAEADIDANLQSEARTTVQFTTPLSSIASENQLVVEPTSCSNEQRSDVEEWWKCIETFRRTGLAEAADREYDYLQEKYPAFEPPE